METVRLTINGKSFAVALGSNVAAAIILSGAKPFRRSVSGEPRAPLCGMGVCFECRVKINGAANQRSCQILVEDGMHVETAE